MPIDIWRGPAPLLLASTSGTRRALLESAGLHPETEPSGLDERATEALARSAGAGPVGIARRLAREKALAVSRRRPDRIVIGADQVLDLDGATFHKPLDRAGAQGQLLGLSGRAHLLHSGLAVAQGGAILRDLVDSASLTMRPLDRETMGRYLDGIDDATLLSIGIYQLEALGAHLFERIEGDHTTILGLPLLPLLRALRELGLLAL